MVEITKRYRITTDELRKLIAQHLATLGVTGVDVKKIHYEAFGVSAGLVDVQAIYSKEMAPVAREGDRIAPVAQEAEARS